MLLKRLIFLYFFLLIFEGALRKWILPGYSDLLLVVRDPLLIGIYLIALQEGKFPFNKWVIGAIALSIITLVNTLAFGHGSLVIGVYGARANFAHLPLIFVMGQALDRDDVIRYAKWMLYLTPPMTVLYTFQFLSPPTAWVNVGPGGEGTASFSGAIGRMRSSGTFTFIVGPVAFYTLAFACLVGLLVERIPIRRWLLVLSGICILVVIPMSVSRMLLLSVGIVSVGFAYLFLRIPGWGRTIPQFMIVFGFCSVVASYLPVFDDAMDAFGARWDESTTQRGGVSDAIFMRVWNDISTPIITAFDKGPIGEGVGLGTNAGARLIRSDDVFLGGEGEWFRVIWEMGYIFGLAYIWLRVSVLIALTRYAHMKIAEGNYLPWLLLFAVAYSIPLGSWAQPTVLGFTVFVAGLAIAAGRQRESDTETLHAES